MNRRQFLASSTALLAVRPSFAQEGLFRTKYFPISAGIGLHDLAPARDGTVWFTAQGKGMLGRLDPRDGSFKTVSLGQGADHTA
ncbi:streptogramin lyase [Bradyrhizobium japonicum]